MKNLLHKIFFILPAKDPVKIVILFCMMLLAAAFEVIGIGMIPAFVAIVADPKFVMDVEWLQPVLSTLDITADKDLLIWGAILLVGVFLVKSAYHIFLNTVEARFIYNRRYYVSHRLMSSYMQAPYTFHLQRNTAELLRNIINEVNVMINVVFTNLLKMSREALLTLAIVGFLLYIEPLITLLLLVLSGLGAGTFIVVNRKKMKKYGEEEQLRRAEMIKAVNQGLGGIKDARVLNRENEFIEKFRKEAYASTQLMAYLKIIQQIPKPVVETTAVVGMLLISVFLVWQGRDMSVIIPILTLFAMATVRLMPSVQLLSSMYTDLRYNMASVVPIYDDLKALEGNTRQFLEDRNKKVVATLQHQIRVDNVSYTYPGSNEQALKDVSLHIKRGKAVGFVGSSGAGKTTMVDLLLGLLEPTSGGIFVDDQDIHENLSAWQQNVGYIPQSIYLADDTLRKNIAFGIPEEKIDEENVQQAVVLAQLDDLVNRLPDGLETQIGENGTRLSGGQRQRVGIARALYHQPQVLVMDEATSALDNITEKEITKAIEALKGERTIIMIAHRLTTVQNCDTLFLMKDGEIVNSGSYEELILSSKEFKKMALVD